MGSYGEQVCAWIKLREGSSVEVEHILEYCAGQITHFKVPRHVRLVDEFPMTVTGKIQKFLMREHMSRELGIETGNPGDET